MRLLRSSQRQIFVESRVRFLLYRNDKLDENVLLEMIVLALIEVEILLCFSLKHKRLQRIAGLAPEK